MGKIYKTILKVSLVFIAIILIILGLFIAMTNWVSKIDKPLSPSEKQIEQHLMKKYIESKKLNNNNGGK